MQTTYGTKITIDNLNDGAQIHFTQAGPTKVYTVQGTTIPTQPETMVTAMGWCINNEMIRIFSPPLGGTYDNYSFDIADQDCAVDQWHMLAVHAWGNLGDHTIETRSFRRLS